MVRWPHDWVSLIDPNHTDEFMGKTCNTERYEWMRDVLSFQTMSLHENL